MGIGVSDTPSFVLAAVQSVALIAQLESSLGTAALADGAVDVAGKDAAASWLSRSSGGLAFSADKGGLESSRSSALLDGHRSQFPLRSTCCSSTPKERSAK